ncbi:MAG TPA: hypothetical protein VK737_08065 [Opitutales bacterium]|nr:hypothetical protein [Opitutales bacterium]
MFQVRLGRYLTCTAFALISLTACSKSGNTAPSSTAAAATTTPAAPPAPVTFKINLTPPWVVGQKFGYVGDETNTAPDGSKTVLHIAADATVLALLPDGDPQMVEYLVTDLKYLNTDIAWGEMPAVGARIVTQYTADNKILIIANGKALTDNAHDFCSDVLTLTGAKHPDQEVLGPAKPVEVNATWSMNTTAFIENESADGSSTCTQASGTIKLDSVQGTGSAQVGTVSGNVDMAGADPADASGHGRDTFQNTVGFEETFPLSAKGVFKQTYTMVINTQPLNAQGALAGPAETAHNELIEQVTIP